MMARAGIVIAVALLAATGEARARGAGVHALLSLVAGTGSSAACAGKADCLGARQATIDAPPSGDLRPPPAGRDLAATAGFVYGGFLLALGLLLRRSRLRRAPT